MTELFWNYVARQAFRRQLNSPQISRFALQQSFVQNRINERLPWCSAA